MITEDYVSFEIAKLLKEKGFNEYCKNAYISSEAWSEADYEPPYTNKSFNEYFEKDCCTKPTIQMAMKWLREVHNINPVPYALSLGWAFDVFDLSNRDITGCKKLYSMDFPSKSEVYNSYEQACEAAIKYCLENLI